MPNIPSRRALRAVALVSSAIALAACAAPALHSPASPSAPAIDHGLGDSGGAEVSAAALALVVAEADGALIMLDLASEKRTDLGTGFDPLRSVSSDGRNVYLAHGTEARTTVTIVDSGRWTVPHGDHSHSFLGQPRVVGTIEGQGTPDVHAGGLATLVRFESDETFLLEHEALAEPFDTPDPLPLTAQSGAEPSDPAVPFADHLLLATSATTIEVHDLESVQAAKDAVPCERGTDVEVTVVGAVFACADGAVLFTREVGGAIAAEVIPYPADATPATQLAGRSGRPDLAGVAGERGAWLLDVRERQWTWLSSDVPLVLAVAIGDDDNRTIALDVEGRVRILDADGTVLVRTDPLVAASVADAALRDRVQLIVDAQHVYLSDPANRAVHEIDHGDGQVTRSFTDVDPWSIQQVG